jgi:hypothetical protein
MKIEIINDNEINYIFLISDSTKSLNLPSLDSNEFLIVDNNERTRLIQTKELEKIFENNDEVCKIYIFPIDLNKEFICNDLRSQVSIKVLEYLNNENVVDTEYFTLNDLDYNFTCLEISKSLKSFLNSKIESFEKQISLSKNKIVSKFNSINTKFDNLVKHEDFDIYEERKKYDISLSDVYAFESIQPIDFEEKIVSNKLSQLKSLLNTIKIEIQNIENKIK